MKKYPKGSSLPSDLKKKYDVILAHEQSSARSVAAVVIRSKPLSVWEVLIPVIFILMFMKTREEREVFVQNLMFTKKMALEAAFQMIRDRRSIEAVMVSIEEKTQELVATAPEGIYSEQIRREQLEEIRLLIDHYARLLAADGADFKTLVTCVYPRLADYMDFTEKLRVAEAQVTAAARRTLGSRTDTGTLARIEAAVSSMRNKQAQDFYPSG